MGVQYERAQRLYQKELVSKARQDKVQPALQNQTIRQEAQNARQDTPVIGQ